MQNEKFFLLGPSQNGQFYKIPVVLLPLSNTTSQKVFVLKQRTYSKSLIEGYKKDYKYCMTPEYIQKKLIPIKNETSWLVLDLNDTLSFRVQVFVEKNT